MQYSESLQEQNALLAERVALVNKYLAKLADESQAKRKAFWAVPRAISLKQYERSLRPLRARVKAMLGYPPPGKPVPAELTIREIGADEDGTFYRVRMPLMEEGLDAYGLLIKPNPLTKPRKNLAVAIHSGGATPEYAAGILGPNNHGDMGRRLARRGHTVWIPACYEMATYDDLIAKGITSTIELHRILDMKARLVGSTLSAIDAYAIIASTEAILASPYCRAKSAFAMGLSYGGFRALVVCALSDIFQGCVSSCYFNDRRQILEGCVDGNAFPDLFFNNTLGVATDVEFCHLICPRPLFIEVGAKDEYLPVSGARRVAKEVRALYRGLGIADRFELDVSDSAHEFSGRKAFQFLDRLRL